MMVYRLDDNDFYIDFTELTEENKNTLNYTTKPMTVGYVKPKFDKDIDEWVEGATPQEIAEWEEANKPKPQEPSEMEILRGEVDVLSEYVLTLEMQNLTLEETTTLNSEYVLDLDTRLTNIENQK